jgi:rhodanese-related sulfurtransferase
MVNMQSVKCLVATLLALALTGCAGTLGTSPKGLEVPIEKAAIKFSADVKEGGYKIVATDELKKWLDDGKSLTIISTMPAADDRANGILPGAVNVALPTAEKDLVPEDREFLLRAAGSNKEQVIVVYCGFVACRRSHIGARMLVDNGYRNVYRYPAGFVGWREAGYGLVK